MNVLKNITDGTVSISYSNEDAAKPDQKFMKLPLG